eukprot:4705167-Prymnesium_polylepis.1
MTATPKPTAAERPSAACGGGTSGRKQARAASRPRRRREYASRPRASGRRLGGERPHAPWARPCPRGRRPRLSCRGSPPRRPSWGRPSS